MTAGMIRREIVKRESKEAEIRVIGIAVVAMIDTSKRKVNMRGSINPTVVVVVIKMAVIVVGSKMVVIVMIAVVVMIVIMKIAMIVVVVVIMMIVMIVVIGMVV